MLSDSKGNPIYFSDRRKATPEELAQYEATVDHTPEELDAIMTGVIDRAREGEKAWKDKQADKRQARRAAAKDRK